MLISPLQKYEPKEWSGLTTENHLGAIYGLEPILVSPIIEHIYNVNLGEDFVSFLDRYPTIYIEDDRPYEWLLQGSDEKNLPLIDAYADDTLAGAPTKAGVAYSTFYMVFPERLFEATDVIVGHKPDTYKLRVVNDPFNAGGLNWAYPVQLVTGDPTLFVPSTELTAGTRWSKEYSLVEQTLSKRGGSVMHNSPFRMQNRLSMIRKQFTVPGNMIRKGQNSPNAFTWVDQNGNKQTTWLGKLDWDFMTQFRKEKARLLLYGNSNRTADGTYENKGDSGYEIRAGAGLLDQISPSNVFYYNDFDLDWMTEIALGLTVGKVAEDNRDFVLMTGEYGLWQFHKAVSEKVSMFVPNFTQDRISVAADGKMSYKGQFLEYTSINGIKFKVMHDPMMDDPIRNKLYHPEGGLAKSREYMLMDFGSSNGEANIQKVALKGDQEIFKYIPGMRDPYSPYNNTTSPGMAASSVDGYEVHRMFIGGIRMKNPMRGIRIIPSILA